jgi:hypothetical protein
MLLAFSIAACLSAFEFCFWLLLIEWFMALIIIFNCKKFKFWNFTSVKYRFFFNLEMNYEWGKYSLVLLEELFCDVFCDSVNTECFFCYCSEHCSCHGMSMDVGILCDKAAMLSVAMKDPAQSACRSWIQNGRLTTLIFLRFVLGEYFFLL